MGVAETRNLGVNLLRRPAMSKADYLRQEMEQIQGGGSQTAQPQMSAGTIEALTQGGNLEQGLRAGGSEGLAELFSPSTEQVAARKLELGEISSRSKRTRALTDALPNSPLALMLTLLEASKSRGKLDELDDLRSRQEKQEKASKKHDKLLASLKAFVGTKAEFEKVFATAFREASEKNPNISEQAVAGMKDIRAILADIIKFPELTNEEEYKFREREIEYVKLLKGTEWKLNVEDAKLVSAGLAAVRAAIAGRFAPGSRQAAAKARKVLAKIGDPEKLKKNKIGNLKEKLQGEKRKKGEPPFNFKIPNSTDPGDSTWQYGTKEELAAFNKANNIVDESVPDTGPDVDPSEIANIGKPYTAAGQFVAQGIGKFKDIGTAAYEEYGAPNVEAAGHAALAMVGLPTDKDFVKFNGPIVSGGRNFNGLINHKNRTYVVPTPRGQYAYGFSDSAPLGAADSLQEAKDIARKLKLPYGRTSLEGLNVQTFPELLEKPTDGGKYPINPITGNVIAPQEGLGAGDVLLDTNQQYSTGGGDPFIQEFAERAFPDPNAGGALPGASVVPPSPLMTPGGYMNAPPLSTQTDVADTTSGAPVSPTGAPATSPDGLPPVDPTKIEFAKASKDVVKANANNFRKDATTGRVLYTLESSGKPDEVSYPLISLGKDEQGIERFKKDRSKPIQAVGLYQVKPSTAKSIIKRNKRFASLRGQSDKQLIELLKNANFNGELAKIIWDEERAALLKNKLVKDWPPSAIKILTFGAYNAGRGKFASLLARAKPKDLEDFLTSNVFGKGYAQTLRQMNQARQLLPIPVGN